MLWKLENIKISGDLLIKIHEILNRLKKLFNLNNIKYLEINLFKYHFLFKLLLVNLFYEIE